jgi:2-polyprenyl-3-methyl-5-hydroxy-6-metoxy-1,4-benzoquinol methylase
VAATVYDRHAAFYIDFVDRGRASGTGHAALLLSTLVDCLGDRLAGARVLDLCCGEGYLGRFLATCGARQVVGVDLSAVLIEEARRRADSAALSYRVDDARVLASEADGAFDVVVSQMAMMDVADHRATFAAVRRVLTVGGPFVFSMLHPCFMAPCHATEAPPLIFDDAGRPIAVSVRRYATEGYWNSAGDGVRGHMGAYHRTLSTYINDLIASGFVLERLAEPLAGDDASQIGLAAEVPTVLVIAARAV